MERNLETLAEHYMTDKREADHNYVEYYAQYFEPLKNKAITLVEIGILRHYARPYEGASLLMWRDYFANAQIHGIDINDHRHMAGERLNIHIADQGNRAQLNQVFDSIGEIDILIEDGSHWMHHQQISLACGFKRLKSGGIYVVEDLLTSHPPAPWKSSDFRLSPNDTRTLDMLIKYQETGIMESQFMTKEEMQYLTDNIKDLKIHRANESDIAFIIKK